MRYTTLYLQLCVVGCCAPMAPRSLVGEVLQLLHNSPPCQEEHLLLGLLPRNLPSLSAASSLPPPLADKKAYTNNGAKVVFLKQRPLNRPPRASGSICVGCDRNLPEAALFCSISCKLDETGGKLCIHVPNSEFLVLPLEEGQMTPDSVLSMRTDSGSSSGGLAGCMYLDSTATTEAVKGKRSVVPSRFGPGCRPASEYNRRKGTPHRSPLH
ncbi:hypothetical protein SASPL_100529 [Salvia splendens]|uniref:Uncharacterized protein n=1 Tax=Salvia splendens TaxID=180675 RepID=A0A8X8YQ01_SALSN|nr:protein RGF1 INDUCIBLE TRANSCRIPTION FACTOR 1-like [Salvia splendens]KAG6435655.1 hypothetical protein SASPL_100529 [Salvia splendens]